MRPGGLNGSMSIGQKKVESIPCGIPDEIRAQYE